jgi:hypothetical protein
MRSAVVLSIGLASVITFAACRSSDGSDSELRHAFHDGVWLLTVDRALRPRELSTVGVPTDPLSEADFAPVDGGARYRLVVSEDAARIEVVESQMVAQLEQATAEQLIYGLVDGAFAGGRIMVWREPSGIQAELTIYGSGVPVVRSERGSVRTVRSRAIGS